MEKYYVLRTHEGKYSNEERYNDYLDASENFNELVRINMYTDFIKIELIRVEDMGAVEVYLRQCTLSYNNDERY